MIKIVVQLEPSFLGSDWVRVLAFSFAVSYAKFVKVKLPSEHTPLVLE